MRYTDLLMETKVRLTDLYDRSELEDTSEQLASYLDEDDLVREFLVHEMTPAEAKSYVTPRNDMTVWDAFKRFAGSDQKRLVKEKSSHYDNSRIIVVINNTVLDGNHHLVAGIMAKQAIKYINLAEYPDAE